MRVQLVEVICDTNFLIQVATRRIKNISNIGVEIGQVSFVVPSVVMSELDALSSDPAKSEKVMAAQELARGFKTVEIGGRFADGSILEHVRENRGSIVATLDKKLKSEIKRLGGSVISLASDRIVLEP